MYTVLYNRSYIYIHMYNIMHVYARVLGTRNWYEYMDGHQKPRYLNLRLNLQVVQTGILYTYIKIYFFVKFRG